MTASAGQAGGRSRGRGGRRWDPVRLALPLACALGVLVAHALVGRGSEAWRSVVLPAVGAGVLVAAFALCALRAARLERDRAAWGWLSAGLGLWTAGWVVSAVTFALGGGRPMPAPADLFYLAFYSAKGARSGYELYRPERDLHSRERLALGQELRAAIGAGELVLHFQPQGELRSGEVLGVEALVRWAHPLRGLLAPRAFLPLAEETDLMHSLTRWVLRAAIAQLEAWEAAGLRLTMAVNLAMPTC